MWRRKDIFIGVLAVPMIGGLAMAAQPPFDMSANAGVAMQVAVPKPPANTAGAALPVNPEMERVQRDVDQLQADTFLLQEQGRRATALKALCETGYGPAELCHTVPVPNAGGPASPNGPGRQGEAGKEDAPRPPPIVDPYAGFPRVVEISGSPPAPLAALLVWPSGARLSVQAGQVLPGAVKVDRITDDCVALMEAKRLVPVCVANRITPEITYTTAPVMAMPRLAAPDSTAVAPVTGAR